LVFDQLAAGTFRVPDCRGRVAAVDVLWAFSTVTVVDPDQTVAWQATSNAPPVEGIGDAPTIGDKLVTIVVDRSGALLSIIVITSGRLDAGVLGAEFLRASYQEDALRLSKIAAHLLATVNKELQER
jgi:hypothetical protein